MIYSSSNRIARSTYRDILHEMSMFHVMFLSHEIALMILLKFVAHLQHDTESQWKSGRGLSYCNYFAFLYKIYAIRNQINF